MLIINRKVFCEKNFALLITIIFSSSVVYAEENDQLINLLIASKATGMCGTLKQLVAFQASTQMTGGDEFLTRITNTEAARLGKTLPDLLSECDASVAIYTRTMEALGFDQ